MQSLLASCWHLADCLFLILPVNPICQPLADTGLHKSFVHLMNTYVNSIDLLHDVRQAHAVQRQGKALEACIMIGPGVNVEDQFPKTSW